MTKTSIKTRCCSKFGGPAGLALDLRHIASSSWLKVHDGAWFKLKASMLHAAVDA
jgi:hypothetical protein